jgi:hypothetical protein
MQYTRAEAKRAVECLRAKWRHIGPYTFARMVQAGGGKLPLNRDQADVERSYVAFLYLGGVNSFYRILNIIRRYDAKGPYAAYDPTRTLEGLK